MLSQNKAIRLISFADLSAHSGPLFHRLEKFTDIYEYSFYSLLSKLLLNYPLNFPRPTPIWPSKVAQLVEQRLSVQSGGRGLEFHRVRRFFPLPRVGLFPF